jgi:outer membrane lipoprotein-sorting protein
MKTFLIILITPFFCFADLATELKNIQEAWGKTKTYTADFKMRKTSLTFRRSTNYLGDLVVQRPNKIVWKQKDGFIQILNGKNFKTVTPKKDGNGNRIEEYADVSKIGDVDFLNFLAGDGKLTTSYDAKLLKEDKKSVTLELFAKKDSSETYVAEFSKTGYTLIALITKTSGNSSRVDFSNTKINEPLKETFTYKVGPNDTVHKNN